jgi:predicted ATPase/class 3 adenylate cyclase
VPELPSGRVTFLFTDIEGSTRLVQEVGTERYAELLARHSGILRSAVEAHAGVEFGSEGDAHFFAFGSAAEALRAAVDAQRSLAAEAWPEGAPVRARMGLHTGTPERAGADYVGVDLNRVARITSAGHGGQILASEATQADASGPGAPVRFGDLGRHRLKDLVEPEHLFQVTAPGLLVEFPPIRTIDTRPKALPAQVASFVGRTRELEEVQRLLSEHRLVTLTGPGGSGKTRLAIAVADRVLPSFDDGIFFVALASLRDPEMVDLTTAGVLGLRETPEQPIRDALFDHLRQRRLLLAFDNFEHLLPAAALVGELLSEAPDIRVLITSRILLRLYGEHEFPVPPLPTPATEASVAQLAANPAVALFVDRAAAVSPGFRLSAENAATIAEICRRLDGLPLAIELAAARIRILSPAQLAARLERRLAALGGSGAGLPERQRTLRGTIEWSHELLDRAQRSLFARASVFDGGWTLEGAEAVVGEGLADVAEVLESVVDQSLARREQADGEPRFSMLETIREYAAEQLAQAGEAEAIAARHATFYLDLAERAEPQLVGEAAAEWARRLGHEANNLRAALRWSLAGDDSERIDLGLRLATGIWRYWQQVGSLSEGREWLDQLLERAEPMPPAPARVRALIAVGGIAYWQTDYDATARRYEAAAELAETVGDQRLKAEAIDSLGYVPFFHGDFARARTLMAQARDLWTEVGETFRAALADSLGDYTLLYEGRAAEAIPAQLRLVDEARRHGERYWLINGLTGVGQLHRATGAIPEARHHYAEALKLALEDGNLAMLTMALEPLSNLEADAGDHERAVRLWAVSSAIREQMGGGAPEEFMMVRDPREPARAAIGNDAVERAWQAGRAMTPSDAVEAALKVAGMEPVSTERPSKPG